VSVIIAALESACYYLDMLQRQIDYERRHSLEVSVVSGKSMFSVLYLY